MTYDSRQDTLDHIVEVGKRLDVASNLLIVRKLVHDASKLQPPEKEAFDEHTPKLRALTYGTPEYEESRKALGEALKHHYANNSHHPEHYENGIRGMSLLDLIEMICDWSAAVKRHADGDLMKSVEINQERFGYSDELKQIFLNTIKELKLA